VLLKRGVKIETDNHTAWIDAGRDGGDRSRIIKRRERAPAQQDQHPMRLRPDVVAIQQLKTVSEVAGAPPREGQSISAHDLDSYLSRFNKGSGRVRGKSRIKCGNGQALGRRTAASRA